MPPNLTVEKEAVRAPLYHAGELMVQARAGVSERSQNAALLIHTEMPKVAREFVASQRMAILSTRDATGAVWASVLAGKPGFMRATDSTTLEIDAVLNAYDPLAANLHNGDAVGVFIIEFSSRMRMKVKGHCELPHPGRIVVHAARVYSQCRKYIQARVLTDDAPRPAVDEAASYGESLSERQQKWIAQADTFFIASYHPETGADAAHRGGNPGFVKVTGPNTLAFPNYWGNLMFNTLGNISLDPHAGLLFIDFATGRTLQIAGTARVIWDKKKMERFPGANQLLEYRVDRTIETPHALPLRWRFVGYAGSNPT